MKENEDEKQARSDAAAILGRKGGAARAKKMTKKQRSEGAKLAARARWEARKIAEKSLAEA